MTLSFFAPGPCETPLSSSATDSSAVCQTTSTNTVSLREAELAGQHGMAASLDAAQRTDSLFRDKASSAILAHLKVVGQASGEDLVDLAIAHGANPPDARAFGGVFQSLARKGLITCVGFALRRKGHGTAGGRIWAAV